MPESRVKKLPKNNRFLSRPATQILNPSRIKLWLFFRRLQASSLVWEVSTLFPVALLGGASASKPDRSEAADPQWHPGVETTCSFGCSDIFWFLGGDWFSTGWEFLKGQPSHHIRHEVMRQAFLTKPEQFGGFGEIPCFEFWAHTGQFRNCFSESLASWGVIFRPEFFKKLPEWSSFWTRKKKEISSWFFL